MSRQGRPRPLSSDISAPAGNLPATSQLGQILAGKLFDAGPPLFILGLDGAISWANAAFRAFAIGLGKQADLLPLMRPLDWLDLAELQVNGTASRAIRATLEGNFYHVSGQFAPLSTENGCLDAIAGLISVTPDVEAVARNLSQLQERFQDVVRLVSDWIWECDEKLNFVSLSDRIRNVMGFHPHELIGRPVVGLAINERSRQTLAARFQHLSPFRGQLFESADKDGRLKLLLISAVPIFDLETGRHNGFRGTASDITELTERERGLVAAKEAAEQASRTKTHFLAHMSHELRTPLNSIIGFSEMMRMQPHGPLGAPEYLDYAGDIHDSANRLLGVINDILDITAVEAGNLVLNETEITLDMIIRPVLETTRHKATAAGLSLHVEAPAELPHLFIDQRVMRQVLNNLLSNAVKFTPPGGDVTLRAALTSEGGMTVSVIDTGIGIDERTLEHLFMPFFQAETGPNRKFEGAGLGLALSKRLVELLGAQLSIVSKRGEGTIVSIGLPASRFVKRPAYAPACRPSANPSSTASRLLPNSGQG
ncbi:MAG: ATP-binding protein [Dongiaceae bacterium]